MALRKRSHVYSSHPPRDPSSALKKESVSLVQSAAVHVMKVVMKVMMRLAQMMKEKETMETKRENARIVKER